MASTLEARRFRGSRSSRLRAVRIPCVPARECSRTACSGPAVSTLTYVYADSTAVLGPLSRMSEPHTYDLCADHSAGLTVPRGWRIIRIPGSAQSDELVALAASLDRPAVPGGEQPTPRHRAPAEQGSPAPGRHLRMVRSGDEEQR